MPAPERAGLLNRGNRSVLEEPSLNLFRLRALRSELAAGELLQNSAARRQTFAAAMTQFEEQLTAAKVVTAATRPLSLYYGLMQAGMAVCAARAIGQWSFNRHGLRLVDTAQDLAAIQVAPEGDGAFQRVAVATRSPLISGPVTIGALWASLPDLAGLAPLPDAVPGVLTLGSDDWEADAPAASLFLDADLPQDVPELIRRLTEILADYPGMENAAVPIHAGAIQPPEDDGRRWVIRLEWPTTVMYRKMNRQEIVAHFDAFAPQYLYSGDRFARRSLEGDRTPPPSPLMTWWLLLYTFSILARYQPRKWTQLLDLDASACAVNLQFALETALSAIPHLLVEAVSGRPNILPKPMAF